VRLRSDPRKEPVINADPNTPKPVYLVPNVPKPEGDVRTWTVFGSDSESWAELLSPANPDPDPADDEIFLGRS
jgi:hypothetical protein